MANETIKPYETKMQKSYNNLLEEYTSIRAGRANPHVLDQDPCRLLWCTDCQSSRWQTYLFRKHV